MKSSEPRDRARDAARIELILYISAASPSSVRAVANLQRLLRRYRSGQVSVSVRNLTEDPSCGDVDQIAFTPTLYKREPAPPMWILGDLSRPEPLLELLSFHGVETTGASR